MEALCTSLWAHVFCPLRSEWSKRRMTLCVCMSTTCRTSASGRSELQLPRLSLSVSGGSTFCPKILCACAIFDTGAWHCVCVCVCVCVCACGVYDEVILKHWVYFLSIWTKIIIISCNCRFGSLWSSNHCLYRVYYYYIDAVIVSCTLVLHFKELLGIHFKELVT